MKTKILLISSIFIYQSYAMPNLNSQRSVNSLLPVSGNESELITRQKTNFIIESIQLKMDNHYANKENYLYLDYQNKQELSDWIDFSLPYDCNSWKTNVDNKTTRYCKVDQVQSSRSYSFEEKRNYIRDMDITINKRTIERKEYFDKVAPTTFFKNNNNFSLNINDNQKSEFNKDLEAKPITINFEVDYNSNISNIAILRWSSTNADFCLVDLGHYGEEYTTNGTKKIIVNHSGNISFRLSCRNQNDFAQHEYIFINEIEINNNELKGWYDIPNEMIIGRNHDIYWNFNDADHCELYLNNSLISTQNKGFIQRSLPRKGTYDFSIYCYNDISEFRDSREIVVNNPNSNIKILFNTPEVVNINNSFRVSWKAENTDFCTLYYDNIYYGRFKSTDTLIIKTERKGFIPIKLDCSNTSDNIIKLNNVLVE